MELPFFLPGAGDWLPIPKTLGTGKVRKPQPLPGQTPSSPPSFEPRPAGAGFRWQACKRRLPTGKARWQSCKRRRQSRRRRLQTCRCRPRSCKRRLQVRKTPRNGPFSPRTPILALFHSPKRESAKTDYCLLITIYCRFRPPNRKPAENCPRPPRISQRRLGTTPPTPGPQTHARFPNARERASSTRRHTAGLACKARPRAVEEHGRPVPPVRLRHDDSCKKYGSKYCY